MISKRTLVLLNFKKSVLLNSTKVNPLTGLHEASNIAMVTYLFDTFFIYYHVSWIHKCPIMHVRNIKVLAIYPIDIICGYVNEKTGHLKRYKALYHFERC